MLDTRGLKNFFDWCKQRMLIQVLGLISQSCLNEVELSGGVVSEGNPPLAVLLVFSPLHVKLLSTTLAFSHQKVETLVTERKTK